MFSHRRCRHVYGRRLRRTIQHLSSPYGGHQVRLLYFDTDNTLTNPSSILVKQRIWKTHPTHSRSSTQYYYSRKHQYVARNSYSDANNGNIHLNRNIIRKKNHVLIYLPSRSRIASRASLLSSNSIKAYPGGLRATQTLHNFIYNNKG